MYSVYILESLRYGRWYIGSTEDPEVRLEQHNAKKVRSTKAYAPYRLIYLEEYETRTEALKREIQIKKSGRLRAKLREKFGQ